MFPIIHTHHLNYLMMDKQVSVDLVLDLLLGSLLSYIVMLFIFYTYYI